jgi:plastocyanin
MITLRGRFVSLVLLATLAFACGGEGDTAVGSQTAVTAGNTATTVTPDTAASTGLTLTIEGRAFGQPPEVAAGESFTIINLDSARHTFSSGDGSWEQVDLAGDSQVSFTVPPNLAPGQYVFFCAIHSDMGGSLTVTG